jgi:hypothetical protein
MSADPFRQWVRREVSELDHLESRHDPQFLSFLATIIGEKVDFPPVCSFYSQSLQICKSLGLSMTCKILESNLYKRKS